MSYDYLSVVKPFAQQAFDPLRAPPTVWRLDAFRVARSLLRLLDNPDAIAQACFGTCGQVAFLRAWSYRDPEAVARFTLDLYAKGSASIGDYKVSASADHLGSTWMQSPPVPDTTLYDKGQWGVGNRITESVWMVCGALAATEDNSFEHATLGGHIPPILVPPFNGQPASDLNTLTLPGELQRWLQKSGCYPGGVEDRTDIVLGKSLAGDAVVTSDFDTSVDVFLCINANLFAGASCTPACTPPATVGAPLEWFPNHWLVLRDKITVSAGTVCMNVWSWGGHYTVRVSLADFDSNYHGSVVARAATPRRVVALPSLDHAIARPRVYYSQDNRLHAEWQRTQNGVQWSEVNRVQAGLVSTPVGEQLMTPRQVLHRKWVADLGDVHHVSLPMPDLTAPHSTRVELAACHAALWPHDDDPSAYNFHYAVPCNPPDHQACSAPLKPLCETDTAHLRLRYYGYPCAQQIADGLDPGATSVATWPDQAVQFDGETLGHCLQDGRASIVCNGSTVVVATEARTPLSMRKLAVCLEHCMALLRNEPLALQCLQDGRRIEVTRGEGYRVQGLADQTPAIGLDWPAREADLPRLCMQALLGLEMARTGHLPAWAAPTYVGRVAIVQTAVPSVVPAAFGDFGSAVKACEAVLVYRAQWKAAPGGRSLQVDVRKALNPALPACVFVEFAHGTLVDGSVSLVLSGTSPDGKAVSIPVTLTPGAGFFYGSFRVANTWAADYRLNLAIQGQRAWPSKLLKSVLGEGLDANPATLAVINPGGPGPVACTGLEAGADKCHHIEVAPQSRFAPQASLTPDVLEVPLPNNSFATATRVTSLVLVDKPPTAGHAASVEKCFERLNFHDAQDLDHFDVSYQCPASDDTDAANRPACGGTSAVLGLSYLHRPPELSCQVTPDDYRCMDVAAYQVANGTPVLLASELRSAGLKITSPSRSLGGKRCLFVLKNHNFASAGAFYYAARFAYTAAFDSMSVDTHAPVFGSNQSLRRKILVRLFDRLDLPRPDENGWSVVQVQDPQAFITSYARLVQQPEIAALLGHSLQRQGGTVVAESMHALGQAAHFVGRVDEAAGLYRQSSDLSLSLGDKAATLAALESLAGLHQSVGDRARYTAVRKEITSLKRRVLPRR